MKCVLYCMRESIGCTDSNLDEGEYNAVVVSDVGPKLCDIKSLIFRLSFDGVNLHERLW